MLTRQEIRRTLGDAKFLVGIRTGLFGVTRKGQALPRFVIPGFAVGTRRATAIIAAVIITTIVIDDATRELVHELAFVPFGTMPNIAGRYTMRMNRTPRFFGRLQVVTGIAFSTGRSLEATVGITRRV